MKLPFTILSVILTFFLSGCSRHGAESSTKEISPVAVETAVAGMSVHQRDQWLPGTVHPAEQAVVAAKLMATVESVDVAIGESVRAGTVLIRLRADEVDARLAQAEATLAQVARNYEREKALLQQSATTAETVRTLEDRMRLAEAQLAESKTMEAYKTIRAPFDGIITAKQVRRGDLATPGAPLLTIEGDDTRVIHVQVPDSLSALPYGTTVKIEADGIPLEAQLAEWSPAADTASRSRLAKLSIGDRSLRSGQYVRVSWPAGQTESIWVPTAAVSVLGQMKRIFTIVDSTARLHLVRTGKVQDDRVQILSGLSAGETVILNPPTFLRDGQPIIQ